MDYDKETILFVCQSCGAMIDASEELKWNQKKKIR